MFVPYFVILTLYSFLKCSKTEQILPRCKTLGYFTPTVQCSNLENPNSLRETLNHYMNRTGSSTVRNVQITNSNFLNIPHDLFRGFRFEQFILDDTSLMSLSDSDTAFEGLEDSLRYLLLYNCSVLNGIDWYQLRNLQALEEFATSNIGLQYIDDEINLIAGLNLTTLALMKDEISHISDNAFAPFLQLQNLILSNNQISDLKRYMFPNPGNKLKEIDLR
ncbi:uncharacterized protein [Parasteatoda tepidariorum]|uniref:uncharacterized protein n=1 Tax=Parasteatoda tepidariorum TaxID=114398 RepID=UPI001C71B1A9|nr:uncharacterized protein LOC122270342 [Parasteatoda tepidariorum]